MKYKILKEFLPNVIVGQECEVQIHPYVNDYIEVQLSGHKDDDIIIVDSYAKQHPEIFQPIEELKENKSELPKAEKMGDGKPTENWHISNFDKEQAQGLIDVLNKLIINPKPNNVVAEFTRNEKGGFDCKFPKIKENETEFEYVDETGHLNHWGYDRCNKCNQIQVPYRNFCSNCGRKRKI